MTPRHRYWAAIGVCVALLAAALLHLSMGEAREPLERWQRVVVIGVPGLDWGNVDTESTPRLDALADRSALGSLTARGASSFSCPRDGWVTLGSGNRARYSDAEGLCSNQYAAGPTVQPDVVIETNDSLNFGAEPGLLGQEVGCVRTYGTDAQLAAINAPALQPVNHDPATAAEWSESWRGCPLALISGPVIDHKDDPDLAEVDQLVGDVAQATAAEPSTLLLVVGVSDRPDGDPSMHLALAYGDGIPSGLMVSASTGRVPYVQLIDVAPTALAALDRERPAAMVGRPMTVGRQDISTADARAELLDAAEAAAAHRTDTPPLVRAWVGLTSAALVIGLLLVHLNRWRSAVRVGGAIVGAFPAATVLANVVPWWTADRSRLAWTGCLLVATLLVVAIAFAGPWRRHRFGPAVAVAAVTALTLALDVITGSHLQLNGMLGYNPLVAGRFTGFGNMPFGIFAVSGLICLAAAMQGQPTRSARWLAVVLGGTMIVIDGTPGLGSDFGGVLALVPAIVLLTMIATDISLSPARVAGALAAGVAAVTVIAIADFQRDTDNQTHLGRFVGQLLDGTAWEVVERKLDASWYILLHSPVAILAPFLVLTLAGLFVPREGAGRRLLASAGPIERAAGVSAATAALLGSLLNDSGIAVFVAAGCVIVPLVLGGTLPAEPVDAEAGETLSREPV
jgi:hypothetical protein